MKLKRSCCANIRTVDVLLLRATNSVVKPAHPMESTQKSVDAGHVSCEPEEEQ
jgi:hypothetical protein